MKNASSAKLAPRLKVWLERGGHPAFGDGKLRWLELLGETGSLRAAAKALRMSYRGLWERLRVMERRLGFRVVTRRTGGAGGGGMVLTDEGRALADAYRRFRRGLDEFVRKRFETHFPSAAPARTRPARRRRKK